jgi:hypothetical protein
VSHDLATGTLKETLPNGTPDELAYHRLMAGNAA